MRRLLASLAAAVALLSVAAAPVLGAMPPDFPEQPGTNVLTACAAVQSEGQGLAHAAPTAVTITTTLLADACVP